MSKPDPLRLADALMTLFPSREDGERAAAELRRLHAENERIGPLAERVLELKAQRDALLTALRSLLSYANVLEMRLLDADGEHKAMQQARAAIKAAEGETNGQA